MKLETLEQQAKDNAGYCEKGQSDTVNGVTVFAIWHEDARRTSGGYHKMSYVVGLMAGCRRNHAIACV